MTVSCYLFVDRAFQVEVFDDRCGTQVKVFVYDFCDFVIRDFACAECVNQYGNGFCNADRVSQLNFTFCCCAGSYDVFRNVSCCVASGTVYFCRVFTGESAAAVSCVTTVCINDDFSACQTGVTHRAADYESACRVDVVFCSVIQQFCGDYFFHYVFDDVFFDLAVFYVGIVLRGYNYCINSYGFFINVFYCYLCFTIGTQVSQCAVFTNFCQSSCQFVRQGDRQGHQFFCFVTCETEHHTLVASACVEFTVIFTCFVFQGVVNTQSDVGGLTVDGCQYCTCFAVETVFCSCIADFCQCFSNDFFYVNVCFCCDFAHYHDHTCCCASFTCYTGIGVFCQQCVQHAVGNLVTDFIGMALCNRFGSE